MMNKQQLQVNSENQYREQQQGSMIMSSTINVKPVKCQDHQNQDYMNFCVRPECMMPLCSECIVTHTKFHESKKTYPSFETIQKIKSECIYKLHSNQNIMQNLYDQIYDMRQIQIYDESDEGIQKINRYKNMILDQVNAYFDDLLDKYKTRAQSLIEKDEKIKNIENRLSQLLHTLITLKGSIDTMATQIDTIKEVNNLDYSNDINEIQAQIKEILDLQNRQSIDILVHENKIRMLKADLYNYVSLGSYLFNGPYEQSNNQQQVNNIHQQQSNVYQQQPNNYQQQSNGYQQQSNVYQQQSNVYQQQPNGYSQQHQLIDQITDLKEGFEEFKQEEHLSFTTQSDSEQDQPSNQNVSYQICDSEISPLQITAQSYFQNFSPHKIIPYYCSDNRTLHFIDVIKNESKKQISVNFLAREFSTTVVTPLGDIYILGGLIKHQQKQTKQVLKYDYTAESFEEKQSMLLARTSFPAVFVSYDNQSYIYVIGGKSEGIPRTNCERYDISKNKWQEMSSLNYSAYSSTVCTFNNKYIYKFGGIGPNPQQANNYVERYDIQKDHWEVIKLMHKIIQGIFPLDTNIQIFPYNCGAVQVNQSQIYIFGGMLDLQMQSSSQFFDVQKEHEGQQYENVLNKINYITLPTSGSFTINPIIQDEKIICLQNISDQITSKKNLLVYKGTGWTVSTKVFN